jgi:uncharacterized protein YbjT (DUF2867 family)
MAWLAVRDEASSAFSASNSVLHPQTEDMPHHWQKLRVEERLFQSGLTCTILQPASYMQNILAGWRSIVAEGVYQVPYALETRLGLVDLADVAEAAAVVLTEGGHDDAIYELAGSEMLTPLDIAEVLSRQFDRPIRAEAISRSDWERQARQLGRDNYQIQTLVKMFLYYELHGLCGNPNVLSQLLGRPPTTLAEFATRTVRAETM